MSIIDNEDFLTFKDRFQLGAWVSEAGAEKAHATSLQRLDALRDAIIAQRWEKLAEFKAFGGYLGIDEAAGHVECSEDWIRKLIRSGRIRASKHIHGLISKADVNAYAKSPRKRGRPKLDERQL